MSRQLFKSTAITGSMTFVSRILGFARDVLFARLFGSDATTDAFFVAFKIPNFLRRLFAEGAFSQAFVPVLADYKAAGNLPSLQSFINKTAGTLTLILFATSVVGVIAAPLLIFIFAPGFAADQTQYDLAVYMLRITFPYLLFISLVAFCGGILNSHGKFAVPAFTPVFLNLCLIAAAIWLAPLLEQPIVALAFGVFAAGIVQLLFQIPALYRLGLLPRLQIGWQDSGVRRILKLMLPAIFGVSITQINLLFDTLIASFLAAGSVSWLYYSDRLVEFPLGVFGIALATVILPNLAKNHSTGDSVAFSKSLDWALRLVLLLGFPASIGLFLLAQPMLATLFQYQQFTAQDVLMAGNSLAAYSIGLLGFILVKVLVPSFSATKDTKTPVRIGIYAIVCNMVLNVAFVFPFAHAGLALATSIAAFVNVALLLHHLLRHKIYIPGQNWPNFIAKIIFAGEVLALFLYSTVEPQQWQHLPAFGRALLLGGYIIAGAAVYALAAVAVGLNRRSFS